MTEPLALQEDLPAISDTRPRLVFTVDGAAHHRNPRSAAVIRLMQTCEDWGDVVHRVFTTPQQAMEAAELLGERTLVLYDNADADGFVRTRGAEGAPAWAQGAGWSVQIGRSTTGNTPVRNCAYQLRADFWKNFEHNVSEGRMPWCPPARTQVPKATSSSSGSWRAVRAQRRAERPMQPW